VGEREGARRHVHFAASVWRFCGAPCGALWSWVDVTDSVERNRDTAAAWHSAAATFQHELRNPLQTMEAVVQLLRPVLPEEGQKFGAMLEQQIQTMSEYLLDQMRPPAPTSFIPDRLSDVVQAEVERAGLRIATRQLRFCHFPPVDEPAVLLHRRSLGRVFANLFRNSAQARVDARVEVRYEVGADRIACVVTDDGPGFAGGADGEVLQPSRYRPERLGLAIVTATVEAHGGCVTAGNAPGGGASVRIVLPARAAGQGADVPAEAAALPAV
jgi:signal transduction histidine kinase